MSKDTNTAITQSTSPMTSDGLFDRVASILEQARSNVVRSVNTNMVLAYWLIGREIVQAVQGGEERTEYGQRVLETLAARLASRYGKGFSQVNLRNFRQFYLLYSNRLEIRYPTGSELTQIGYTTCSQFTSPEKTVSPAKKGFFPLLCG